MRVLSCLLSLWCLATPSLLLAQNQLDLGSLQPGQLVLNLSATEQQEISQDTLNATVGFSVQGRNQATLQGEVNAAIAKALAAAKAVDAVNVQTGYYQVYQVQNDPGVFNADNPVWRAQQSIQLDSLQAPALLALIGDLQAQGLTVANLWYTLSTERYEEVAAALTTQVLQTLQQRAESAGKALGKPVAALIEVSLDGNANVPMMREAYALARSAVDMTVTTPSAEPGETTVSVSVSARAILSP